jgi:hypothetical protein
MYNAPNKGLAKRRGMRELAEAMPGFISFKTFQAEDGERVSLIEYKTGGTGLVSLTLETRVPP